MTSIVTDTLTQTIHSNGGHRWRTLTSSDSERASAVYRYGDTLDDVLGSGTLTNEWYLADSARSIAATINSLGVIVAQPPRSAFGLALTAEPADALGEPGFHSRPTLPMSLEVDFRARRYDAQLGRFSTADPLRFDSGDLNLYRFARNNPVQYRDPTGLATLLEGAVTTGMTSAVVGGILGAIFGAHSNPTDRAWGAANGAADGAVKGFWVGFATGFIIGAVSIELSYLAGAGLSGAVSFVSTQDHYIDAITESLHKAGIYLERWQVKELVDVLTGMIVA